MLHPTEVLQVPPRILYAQGKGLHFVVSHRAGFIPVSAAVL